MSVKLLYTVHGATIENETGRASGWQDSSLTALGIKQSEELKEKFTDVHYDAVFSSDLVRAKETATIAFGANVFETDDRLREANYGDLNGAEHTFKDSLIEYVDTPFPNGESYSDVLQRVSEFLDDVRKLHDNQTVVLAAHQAPQLVLEVLLNEKHWVEAIKNDWRRTHQWQPFWQYLLP